MTWAVLIIIAVCALIIMGVIWFITTYALLPSLGRSITQCPHVNDQGVRCELIDGHYPDRTDHRYPKGRS